jgi:triacylglycerol lipase
VLTRVVDENDVVPMLPPESRRSGQYGLYEHIGREIILLEGPYCVELPNHVAAPLSIDDSWRSLATAKLGDHHIADYLARLSTKLVSAVSVPYEDREKYVARSRK